MQEAFQIEKWDDADREKDFEMTSECISKRARSVNSPSGMLLGAEASLGSGFILALIATGGDKWSTSFFRIMFNRPRKFPDLSFFRKAVEVVRPFEAFIAVYSNEQELNAYERQRQHLKFDRPATLRWFHYLNAELVSSVGGIRRCLSAPVFKAERICQGVLFQVTKEWFDNSNPEHRDAQLRAMEYLGIED
jgi:hypothetical protein